MDKKEKAKSFNEAMNHIMNGTFPAPETLYCGDWKHRSSCYGTPQYEAPAAAPQCQPNQVVVDLNEDTTTMVTVANTIIQQTISKWKNRKVIGQKILFAGDLSQKLLAAKQHIRSRVVPLVSLDNDTLRVDLLDPFAVPTLVDRKEFILDFENFKVENKKVDDAQPKMPVYEIPDDPKPESQPEPVHRRTRRFNREDRNIGIATIAAILGTAPGVVFKTAVKYLFDIPTNDLVSSYLASWCKNNVVRRLISCEMEHGRYKTFSATDYGEDYYLRNQRVKYDNKMATFKIEMVLSSYCPDDHCMETIIKIISGEIKSTDYNPKMKALVENEILQKIPVDRDMTKYLVTAGETGKWMKSYFHL